MVQLREAKWEDIGNIGLLRQRYGLGGPSGEKDLRCSGDEGWRHYWQDNPAMRAIHQSWPIGWVLEDPSVGIVGYLGNIPLMYEYKGERVIVAVATGWVVDVKYRNSSLLLITAFFGQAGADLLLNTTANPIAEKVFSAFKARRVPISYYDTPLFWIVDYRKFISSVLSNKGYPALFRRIMAIPLAWGLWSVDIMRRKNRWSYPPPAAIRLVTDFDERFDVFWETLQARSNRFLCVRSAECLRWHFKKALTDQKVWIFVMFANGLIISYAIFRREDNEKIGLKRVRLVDWQTQERDSSLLTEFISAAIGKCRTEGVHMLEVMGFHASSRRALEILSPYQRKLPSWPFFYKVRRKMLEGELETPDVWDPCPYDGDASL